MKIGAHVSAAGNLALAPKRSQDLGCECFQFFSRSPQGGTAKPVTKKLAEEFKTNMKEFNQAASYIHAPYFINLASAKRRIYYGSISIICQELERANKLGVDGFMFHIGSAKDLGQEKSIAKVVDGIYEIIRNYHGQTDFMIEISAGSGEVIGDKFEEIAQIIDNKKLKKYKINVCFDTAHAFASGYDLRDEKSVKASFKKFDQVIGLKRLKLIHVNDSKADFNSKKDRHEHIGRGKIGIIGFQAIIDFAKKQKLNLILETPHDEQFDNDIKLLKKMRDKK